MKKGLKKLAASATVATILTVPIATITSGGGNGQEAKALSGFYFYNWDDIYDDWDDRYDNWDDWDDRYDWDDWDDRYDWDDWDDRYDFDDYLDDYYDRWDD